MFNPFKKNHKIYIPAKGELAFKDENWDKMDVTGQKYVFDFKEKKIRLKFIVNTKTFKF